MLLSEDPHIRLIEAGGPVVVLARHHGKYVWPVHAYFLDMRLEDQKGLPSLARLQTFTWTARHPTEPYWLIQDGTANGKIYSRMSDDEYSRWLTGWRQRREARPPARNPEYELPRSPFPLPDGWWEYVVAMDKDRKVVKAALVPRHGEPTAEDTDERQGDQMPLSAKLEWIFR